MILPVKTAVAAPLVTQITLRDGTPLTIRPMAHMLWMNSEFRHPRFVSHFVPTRSSWLNLVERWFGELTRKRIRRGSFASVADLHQAIEEFLRAWNENPKPFVWTATVASIIAKLSRCRQTMETSQPGCTLRRTRKTKK